MDSQTKSLPANSSAANRTPLAETLMAIRARHPRLQPERVAEVIWANAIVSGPQLPNQALCQPDIDKLLTSFE